MKCFYHYEIESQAVCSVCSHPLCVDCIIDVQGKTYCRECIEKAQKEHQPTLDQRTAQSVRPEKSSALATWLSLLPGLGFIYLGLYLKGIAIFVTWIGLISIFSAANEEIAPLIGIAFWIFQLVYTNQEAKRLQRVKTDTTELPQEKKEEASIFWGIIVLIVGIFFLIHNLGFNLSWLVKFWPLIIVALGIHLIWSALNRKIEA